MATDEPTATRLHWIDVALGAWLFVSAFLWPHTPGSMANTWIVGLLIVIAGLLALSTPWIRWFEAAIALWLLFSTIAISPHAATRWNNLIVASLVFLVSLVPGALFPIPRRPRRSAPT